MSGCEIRQANDVTLVVTAIDCDTGQAVPLDGATVCDWAMYALKGYPDDNERWEGAALLTKGLGAGVTIVDAPNGVVEVELAAADTAAQTPTSYYNELKIVDAQGKATNSELADLTILSSALQS